MRTLLLLIISCCLLQDAFCQNIGINATGARPNPSAMLDVSASDKGMLIPRTSSASRTAIANPAKGLLLYDTTSGTFWYHDGNAWVELSSGGSGTTGNFWTVRANNISNNNTGNVGIGTNNPGAKLTLQTPINTEGFRHVGGADSIIVSEGIGGVSASIGTASNHAFRLVAGGQARMSYYPTGEVVVGDNNSGSFGKFSVNTLNNSYGISHLGEGGNILATRMGGTSAGIGTFSNTNMRLFANGISALFINASNGNVGIGVDLPVNKFQIGLTPGALFTGYDFSIGNNGQAMSILQTPVDTRYSSSTNITLVSKDGRGNIGVNTTSPTNYFQVGDVGTSGFAGNNFATGNGLNAMAIYQDDVQTIIGSTTDIVLKPRNNGQGRVGINTNTPRAPLDVVGIFTPNAASIQYTYMNQVASDNGLGLVFTGSSSGHPTIANVSIMASGNVYANEFDAYSDARIKNIRGRSDAAKDLAIINDLQIKDYTMKDKVVFGDKPYKKVIAQEVEKVYPQIVSKHTDFIPNVYQFADNMVKTADGYLLSFRLPHHLDAGAKKIQALMAGSDNLQPFDIISIPSDKEVVIRTAEIKSNKIFVYGEEVSDFRTVDYEGLTTLSISAMQELTRLVKKQSSTIIKQQKRLLQQQMQMNLQERRLSALEKGGHPAL